MLLNSSVLSFTPTIYSLIIIHCIEMQSFSSEIASSCNQFSSQQIANGFQCILQVIDSDKLYFFPALTL